MSDPQPPSPLEHRPAIFNQLGPKDRGYLTQAIKSREKRAKQAAENMASEQTYVNTAIAGTDRLTVAVSSPSSRTASRYPLLIPPPVFAS